MLLYSEKNRTVGNNQTEHLGKYAVFENLIYNLFLNFIRLKKINRFVCKIWGYECCQYKDSFS